MSIDQLIIVVIRLPTAIDNGNCYHSNENNRSHKMNDGAFPSAPIPIPDNGSQKQRQQQRRRKKRTSSSITASNFSDLYSFTGEMLGEGAYASVRECKNNFTGKKYAVKIIDKTPGHSRSRVFREIEIFYHCQGHRNIIQLVEFFEEANK